MQAAAFRSAARLLKRILSSPSFHPSVDPATTFADLAGNLLEALGKPFPDLSHLAPHNQAVALFNSLNATDQPRLVILDQFENLLDWETGHAFTDRPGVGEWVNIINSQARFVRVV